MVKNKLVSIVIINYNGYYLLKDCLKSILKNSYKNYEIIIADNGSTDKTIEKIKTDFSFYLSRIKILNLKKNLGPAIARNKAFKLAKGDIISFLDNDTKVDKNWIIEALNLFESNKKIGAIQCKLLLLNQKNKIDCVGELISNFGFLRSIASYGEIDKGQYDKNYSIFAAKSAGMFITRSAFTVSGQFDPSYFIFMEETDLAWKVWLKDYSVIFCPKSIVYHKFSSTKDIVSKDFNNYLVRFHGSKNYIQTLIKNLSLINLIKILPIHIFIWFCLATFFLLKLDYKSALNTYKGILWNLIHINEILLKRKKIQKNRKLSDNEIFIKQNLMIKTKPTYYIKKLLF